MAARGEGGIEVKEATQSEAATKVCFHLVKWNSNYYALVQAQQFC